MVIPLERDRPSPATFLREGVLCEYPDRWDSEIATPNRFRRYDRFSVGHSPELHDWKHIPACRGVPASNARYLFGRNGFNNATPRAAKSRSLRVATVSP